MAQDQSCSRPPPRFGTRIQLVSERGFGSFRNAGQTVSGKRFLGTGFWEVVSGEWFLGSGFWEVFLGSGEGLSPTQRHPKEARP